VPRKRHPDKHVEGALRYAEERGWRIETLGPRAHGWGRMYCPHNDPTCRCGAFCMKVIWSTPTVPENLARQIRRAVDGCVHTGMERKGAAT
jgi:hypothetical protein